MKTLEESARLLTLKQPTLTFFEARDLLIAAYRRLSGAKGYGNLFQTCMEVEFGILCRLTEAELDSRLTSLVEDR